MSAQVMKIFIDLKKGFQGITSTSRWLVLHPLDNFLATQCKNNAVSGPIAPSTVMTNGEKDLQ